MHTIEELRVYRKDRLETSRDWSTLLLETPREERLCVALLAALVKWEPGAERRGFGSCALCCLIHVDPRFATPDDSESCCPKCPLSLAGHCCDDPDSVWRRWNRPAQTKRDLVEEEEYADIIYNTLKELYEKEKQRVNDE